MYYIYKVLILFITFILKLAFITYQFSLTHLFTNLQYYNLDYQLYLKQLTIVKRNECV